jgi:hypothetical protein
MQQFGSKRRAITPLILQSPASDHLSRRRHQGPNPEGFARSIKARIPTMDSPTQDLARRADGVIGPDRSFHRFFEQGQPTSLDQAFLGQPFVKDRS